MVRVAISVEGPTERDFVQKVLCSHLVGRDVHVYPVDLKGNVSLDKAVPEVLRLVKNSGNQFVTTLYDLYGFKGRKPGETAEDIERALAGRVGYSRQFFPYVQRYEFEALIFAGPDQAAGILRDPDVAEGMRQALRERGAPEDINDGYDTCPSRRLKALHTGYDKVRHGPPILERIGLAAIRAACPRFGGWLDWLESLTVTPAR